jgi:hypothetical protein
MWFHSLFYTVEWFLSWRSQRNTVVKLEDITALCVAAIEAVVDQAGSLIGVKEGTRTAGVSEFEVIRAAITTRKSRPRGSITCWLTHSLKLSLPPPGFKSSYVHGKPYDLILVNGFYKRMIYNVILKPNRADDSSL